MFSQVFLQDLNIPTQQALRHLHTILNLGHSSADPTVVFKSCLELCKLHNNPAVSEKLRSLDTIVVALQELVQVINNGTCARYPLHDAAVALLEQAKLRLVQSLVTLKRENVVAIMEAAYVLCVPRGLSQLKLLNQGLAQFFKHVAVFELCSGVSSVYETQIEEALKKLSEFDFKSIMSTLSEPILTELQLQVVYKFYEKQNKQFLYLLKVQNSPVMNKEVT